MSATRYPIGIQSFEKLRQEGYLYVDKTAIIHRLANESRYYFLSRPRRFGKSLLLSTLEALFKGKRDLFRGLAIDSLNWDWEEHEVLHLDLNARFYQDETSLTTLLERHLKEWENLYGVKADSDIPEDRFVAVIKKAYEMRRRGVVILADEYDKPLFSTLGNPSLNERYRQQLQAFYSVLKTMDEYIRLGFLTGVTRFSKVTVFGGLNNLRDISLSTECNAVCGITESELNTYFAESISDMAEGIGISEDALRCRLKDNYDGYHFSRSAEDIYNPFSILNVFTDKELNDYWYATGTPTTLVRLLEDSAFPVRDMDPCYCKASSLSGADIYLKDPIPLFFQCGYLTIKGYNDEFSRYTLGFPNKEVARGFSESLMQSYMHGADKSTDIDEFVMAARAGKADEFMERLQTFTEGIPYDHARAARKADGGWVRGGLEAHYQNVMYVVFKLMGFYTHTEYKTSRGRIDMVVETTDFIYLMELKVDSTPKEALRQIDTMEYFKPFLFSGKKVFKIGANFDTSTRALSGWEIV